MNNKNKARKVLKQKAKISTKQPPDINLDDTMTTSKPLTKKHKWLLAIAVFLFTFIIIIIAIVAYGYLNNISKTSKQSESNEPANNQPDIPTGKILQAEQPQTYDATQTLAIIKQANRAFDLPVTSGIKKQLIRYTSSDGTNNDVPIYGRVYYPQNMAENQLPILAFAPGTTGIGDECAGSLENPAKRDWANYDSKMAAYASQGYIVVITDYEGMRDSARLHHYMVGELEGRAVLDSIRAVKNLDNTKNNVNNNAIFAGGYSQGGHAAYWADQLAPKYSPEIKLAGALGYGPVTDVTQTLTDAITANANINWFGPFVLVSYQDWYKRKYPVDKILLPQWSIRTKSDVLAQCIDTVDKFWPSNIGTNKSSLVYTPQFIAAAKSGNIANDPIYKQFAADMLKNITGTVKTATPVLINQGLHDNVILARQSEAAKVRFCKTGNAVTFRLYDKSPYAVQTYNPIGLVDHYQTMNASLKDSLAWMNGIAAGQAQPNNCS